jgi:hypothetical protein
LIHLDLQKTNFFQAAMEIRSWVAENDIKVLNVAGPRASKDAEIYESTKKLLKAVFQLDLIQGSMPDPQRVAPHLPATLNEAVKELLSKLPLKDKILIAKMTEDELTGLHPTLGVYVRERFGLWSGNKLLMESCRLHSDRNLDEDECSAFIVKELWTKLRASHRLRVVK